MYSVEISIPVDVGVFCRSCVDLLGYRVAYEAIEVEMRSSLLPFEYLGVSHQRCSLFD